MTRWPKGSRRLALDESEGSAHLAVPCSRAMCLQHPRSLAKPVDPSLEAAIKAECSGDPVALARRRIEDCQGVSRACKDSASQEDALRKGLRPQVASVTAGKKSVALESLLRIHGTLAPQLPPPCGQVFH